MPKTGYIKLFFFSLFFSFHSTNAVSQRTYANQSILATGNWYKIAISKEGIYKVNLAFLNSCGINTQNLTSGSIKLFGNNTSMLPEANKSWFADDLQEIPLEMNDAGDGFFNGNDYFLFYAQHTSFWQKDSLNKKFSHQKNLYSDSAYYYLNISPGNGKRITTAVNTAIPNQTSIAYNERIFYENDAVNFLNSGKNWYGDELSLIAGNNLAKTYIIDGNAFLPTAPVILQSSVAARSVGSAATVITSINNTNVQTHTINGVSGGFLDVFANTSTLTNQFTVSPTVFNIMFNYINPVAGSQVWIDWFELHGRKKLVFENEPVFSFRDWETVGNGNIVEFHVSNASAATEVWETTNPLQPEKMFTNLGGNTISFIHDANRLREYIAFKDSGLPAPAFVELVNNQNLHQTGIVKDIIITHKNLLSQAKRLAQFHINQFGLNTIVVTVDEIYNEFSAGNPDPAAIRNFVKMLYDRAAGDTAKQPKYLLLFGASSFDYKNRVNGNTNLVPGYESINSLNPLLTYTTDDFFGFLDDTDDINNNPSPSKLDIAIGRLPARSIDEATIMVDKIIAYHLPANRGGWQNNIVFVADDGDNNLHLNDAELMVSAVNQADSVLNVKKIYLDAYKIQNNSSGATYPDANNAIVNTLNNGSLILNYTGHGSSQILAEEKVFTQDEIKRLNNNTKLPLFVTATCDFSPFDDPTKNSLGHHLLFASNNGAIGLVSTTRVVYASSNKVINENFLNKLFLKNSSGLYPSLGETMKHIKNLHYPTVADIINNQKFALLADPVMQPALPDLLIQIDSVNNNTLVVTDTLKPLHEYKLTGSITDVSGSLVNNFSGIVEPTIFNPPQRVQTLGNTATSPVTGFSVQENILFKGKASVVNGRFNFSFTMPKDAGTAAGKAKISLYANTTVTDAGGYNHHFFVGGTSGNIADNTPPTIKAYFNDEKFVNGGLVNEKPLLLLKLYDSSGINASGLGIGHDITLVIDGKENETIVLNNYYEALLNSYRNGSIRFPMPVLSNGKHMARIKVWDIANNSQSISIEFEVAQEETLTLSNVYNYPNPFINSTVFMFQHNQPGQDILVQVDIYSISGKLVHQIIKTVNTVGNLCSEIFWDGKDKNNEKLANGVYIYTIIAISKHGKARKTQKLYLL